MHRVFIMVYLFLHVKNLYDSHGWLFSVTHSTVDTPQEVFGAPQKNHPLRALRAASPLYCFAIQMTALFSYNDFPFLSSG